MKALHTYSRQIESVMRSLYRSLRECDRRRYAAVEAQKLGYGGVEYIARVLGCDPKTIRVGLKELPDLPKHPSEWVRHKGRWRSRK
jgi:hypothetical protein